MQYSLVIISSVLAVVGRISASPCTEDEHREMQAEFSECRSSYTSQYHASGLESGLCTLLDQIINICSQKWKQCHTTQEIYKMKEMHTSAFIQHWEQELDTDDCPTIVSFRESQTMEPVPEIGCSREESTAAMTRFQNCAHTISSHLYTQVNGVTLRLDLMHLLCKALGNISSECPVHLHTCLAPADVTELTGMQVDQMKGYFSNLVSNKITADELDACEEKMLIESTTAKPHYKVAVTRISSEHSSTEYFQPSSTKEHSEPQIEVLEHAHHEVHDSDVFLEREESDVNMNIADEERDVYIDKAKIDQDIEYHEPEQDDPYEQVLRDLNLDDMSYDGYESMTNTGNDFGYSSWSSENSLDDISRILKVNEEDDPDQVTEAAPRTVQVDRRSEVGEVTGDARRTVQIDHGRVPSSAWTVLHSKTFNFLVLCTVISSSIQRFIL